VQPRKCLPAEGDIEKSIAANMKMLELAPDFSLGYNNLANAYYMKGEYNEAISTVTGH